MVKILRLIGGAGTGKTTEQLRLMEKNIESGFVTDPFEIGYVSMTRAARQEGADRAARRFNCSASSLQDEGYFRTFHSICKMQMRNTSGLLVGDKETRDWMREKMGITPQRCDANEAAEGGSIFNQSSPQGIALTIWDVSRLRIVPFEEAHRQAKRLDPKVPPLSACREHVIEYERQKYLSSRCDFVDLLASFTGYRFTVDGISTFQPEGEVPKLPKVWFFDEMQDCSPLVNEVAKRLVREGDAKFVYLAGDPFQAIYAFAGSDANCFLNWEVNVEKTMPKTWRCAPRIHELGEQILRRCGNYFDRGIEPASHGGEVYRPEFSGFDWSLLKPQEEWLVLARTNEMANEIGQTMTRRGIPWFPTKGGGGGWSAPVRNKAIVALRKMARKEPVTHGDFQAVVKNLPANHEGEAVFVRGAKKKWAEGYYEALDTITPGNYDLLDLTPRFMHLVETKGWLGIIPKAEQIDKALDEHGESSVTDSKILVGTIHSAKGMEADGVVIWPEIPGIVAEGMKADPRNMDEERRLQYVGVTRTRGNLYVLQARHLKHQLPFN